MYGNSMLESRRKVLPVWELLTETPLTKRSMTVWVVVCGVVG